VTAEALHPLLRRSPSVQDYERMTDRARAAAVALIRAETAAIEERRARVQERRAHEARLVDEWADETRRAAARFAVEAIDQFDDTPDKQAARRTELRDALDGVVMCPWRRKGER
jgi:hypothetical protein